MPRSTVGYAIKDLIWAHHPLGCASAPGWPSLTTSPTRPSSQNCTRLLKNLFIWWVWSSLVRKWAASSSVPSLQNRAVQFVIQQPRKKLTWFEPCSSGFLIYKYIWVKSYCWFNNLSNANLYSCTYVNDDFHLKTGNLKTISKTLTTSLPGWSTSWNHNWTVLLCWLSPRRKDGANERGLQENSFLALLNKQEHCPWLNTRGHSDTIVEWRWCWKKIK